MTPKKATPQELNAQETGPIEMLPEDLDTCPTCLSGVEGSTLDPSFLAILKR